MIDLGIILMKSYTFHNGLIEDDFLLNKELFFTLTISFISTDDENEDDEDERIDNDFSNNEEHEEDNENGRNEYNLFSICEEEEDDVDVDVDNEKDNELVRELNDLNSVRYPFTLLN